MTKLRITRNFVESSSDAEGMLRLHRERAALLHSTFNELGVEVQDWGDTDDARSHEWVEIVVTLAPVLLPPLVEALKAWLDSRKVSNVEIVQKDGTQVSIRGATPAQIEQILGST